MMRSFLQRAPHWSQAERIHHSSTFQQKEGWEFVGDVFDRFVIARNDEQDVLLNNLENTESYDEIKRALVAWMDREPRLIAREETDIWLDKGDPNTSQHRETALAGTESILQECSGDIDLLRKKMHEDCEALHGSNKSHAYVLEDTIQQSQSILQLAASILDISHGLSLRKDAARYQEMLRAIQESTKEDWSILHGDVRKRQVRFEETARRPPSQAE